jgi:hypothetical protein
MSVLLIDCAGQFCLKAAIAICEFCEDLMIDESLARLCAYRQNIDRYRRLLRTNLTALEQNFIERRIAEEQLALDRLAAEAIVTTLSDTPRAA